jgi:putative membrane protein
MIAAFFAFLHHLAAFALVSAIAAEFLMMREELTLRSARRMLFADMIIGIAAATVLAAGLLRVFFFEKGSNYYAHNAFFIAKISLFVAIALLSIYPTREFLSWRKGLNDGRLPATAPSKLQSIRSVIHLELAGIGLILLCAALMAKGIGSF